MKTIIDFQKAKNKEILTWITAYSFDIAMAAESAGIDQILVGDSGYMCLKGYPNTNYATMDGMIDLCQSVRKGAKNTFLWGDMPSSSYEPSNEIAIQNALRFIKEGECNGVKLEGATKLIADRISNIRGSNITICAHVGLTPQSSDSLGGYKCQGKTLESFNILYNQCKQLQECGANMILLEAVPPQVTKQIQNSCKIPIAAIGGGLADIQLIISSDLLGLYPTFRPKFAKCYIPEILDIFKMGLEEKDNLDISLKEYGKNTRKDGLFYLAELAIYQYIQDVKSGKFPSKDECYNLKEEELNELRKSRYWDITKE